MDTPYYMQQSGAGYWEIWHDGGIVAVFETYQQALAFELRRNAGR